MESRERKRLMSAAYRYAYARLALNYYTFCEMMLEQGESVSPIRAYEQEFGGILDRFLGGEEECLAELDRLRRKTMQDMEILTSYGDSFGIYEYVLKRMERRFVRMDPVTETPEEYADRIVDSLRLSKDAVILDRRLRSIVSQLPVRYTRQKFYSLVTDKMTTYIGAGRSGVDGLFYMLRTSAMIEYPAGRAEAEPELQAALSQLQSADLRGMDEAGFKACVGSLNGAIDRFHEKVDVCLAFENLLNDLYVVFLSRKEAMIDALEDKAFRHVMEGVREHFKRERLEAMDETLTESLEDLEGIQESAMERIRFREEETDEDLKKIEKLLSASAFVPLDEKPAGSDEEPADRAWVEEKSRRFCEELEEAFAGMPRPVMRAVMASILSQLPMNFKSVDELHKYVVGSLLSCTDFAEREASMELLEQELFEQE